MRHLFLLGAATAALIPATAFAQDSTSKPADSSTIVVTGSPLGSQTPTIVATVDRDQIVQTGGGNIADSLAQVPGIAGTGFASGASRPIIRGMDATRVRMLEDGSSASDVSDIGPDHGVPIDPLSAQRIEVVRGAATLRYGSQAIGGVVNVINNRVPTELPTRDLSGEASGSYATNADTWQTAGLVDAKAGDLALHADGFYRHAGDYETPLGTMENSFIRGWGGSLGGSYFFGADKGSHIGAAVVHYDTQYGIPADEAYIDMHQTKVIGRSSFELGDGLLKSLDVDASYGDYQHQEKNPDGSVNTTFKNKEFDSHAELLFGQIGIFSKTALGIQVGHRDFSAIGEDSSYLSPATSQSEAAYLFTEVPVGALHIQASGRVENVHIEGTPASDVFTKRDYTPLSGAIGALLDVSPGVKLGVTFSSTGRAPALTELFARGGHDGPQTFETGDPSLKIERANSLEGTIRVNSGPFRFEGSVYGTWFHNYIYGDLTGRTCDDDGACVVGDSEELKELNYGQQGAKFWGLEGDVHYQLLKTATGGLEAHVLGDYTRAKLDDGDNVPRIPPYRIGGGLNWKSDRFDAGFLWMHVGEQDKYGVFDTPTDGYENLSANIAVRPFASQPGIELAIVGQNLTNDVIRNASAFNKEDVVMPGRTVRFVLRVATF
ncbi:TonB-dependent receptor [Sphingomonas sp. HITSZ_GF]|uniref:TonB-dependent receptor n=1 Tax=Sphingomonas sp. HITSZ_GF TaxID=3037247 RepID=UPI00240E0C91|nr:TonB-dependent receptor [Sphingomonas sp. HITSZ_GF]MDG2534566.1 TonB-dependent receptor [Sphingomonas sp. HITSZ_GF]